MTGHLGVTSREPILRTQSRVDTYLAVAKVATLRVPGVMARSYPTLEETVVTCVVSRALVQALKRKGTRHLQQNRNAFLTVAG